MKETLTDIMETLVGQLTESVDLLTSVVDSLNYNIGYLVEAIDSLKNELQESRREEY